MKPKHFVGSQNGWIIGDVMESCDTACHKVGLECTIKGLKDNNGDVDTPGELISLIKRLGGKITASSCSGRYGDFADIPNFSESLNFCNNAAAARSHFSCSVSAGSPASERKQRLCYCSKGINQYTHN